MERKKRVSRSKNVVVAFAPRPSDIEARVRELASTKDVRWSEHALDRMEEREISRLEVLRVLRLGSISGDVHAGKHPGEWKVKMTFRPKGSREIGVVTVVLNMECLLLKTVEWEDL